MLRLARFVACLTTVCAIAASPRLSPAEGRQPCSDENPLREVYFGDLHVHTAYSQDASTQGTRNRPRDAYRFARGEPLGIQPYDQAGNALRTVRLARPLDFAAVTDHAEMLGETEICQNPELEGYDGWVCRTYRSWPRVAFFIMNYWASSGRRFAFCGEGGERCLAASLTPWRDIQDAAEGAYDRSSACRFTSFVGYEWTGARDFYNLHRNVIFRNEVVPKLPASFIDAGSGPELWRALAEECLELGSGCDAIVIPHNSNLSGGLMFETLDREGAPITRAQARARAKQERLVEVMQHKGDSECLLGAPGSADELCAFEKLPYDSFNGRYVSLLANPPEPASFVRNALREGLRQSQRLGVNPFAYGLIASSDTHLGTPGLVSERTHPGHGGAGSPSRDALPTGLPDAIEFNPGGLAAIWAEANERDSLFDAMQRREVYGTSGPRMRVRFFAGWDYPDDLCSRSGFAERGYASGVPMGGDLPPRPAGDPAPVFAVWALRDPGGPGSPGGALQRIQIVKGWTTGDSTHERVFEVAGNPNNGATVDLATCEPRGPGADQLCTVWRDPDFDPAAHAFYYARVVENPSCRWSTYVCNAHAVDCGKPQTVGEGLEPCCDPRWSPTIQERAWTSPVWYAPPGGGA